MAHRCGQCTPCRILKRREWASRLMLEQKCHESSVFITLTYAPHWLPEGNTLVPRDLQLFMKRIRKRYNDRRLRFFGVGEYGDESDRPHYHVALFGADRCYRVRSHYTGVIPSCCPPCDMVRDSWLLGNVHVGELTEKSASYIAGYTTKKLTVLNDKTYEILGDRHPEFARMSNRPGIGAEYADRLINSLSRNYWKKNVDVPYFYMHDGKQRPLGRYLKQRMRRAIGLDETTPDEVKAIWDAEMRAMYENAKSSPIFEAAPEIAFREQVVEREKVNQVKRRSEIFKQRRKL